MCYKMRNNIKKVDANNSDMYYSMLLHCDAKTLIESATDVTV